MKLVAPASSIDQQCVTLAAEQVEDGCVVIRVYCRQRGRFLTDQEGDRAGIETVGLIDLLATSPPCGDPAAVDLVDRLTRRNGMLSQATAVAPGAFDARATSQTE